MPEAKLGTCDRVFWRHGEFRRDVLHEKQEYCENWREHPAQGEPTMSNVMYEDPQPKCELCGQPMPLGEEMFKYHGHSGPCPKPRRELWKEERERAERAESALREAREKALDACLDMANRYDQDIEGCDGDELLQYGEGIKCCFRLAYIIKYGQFPPNSDAWASEFVDRAKALLALKDKS